MTWVWLITFFHNIEYLLIKPCNIFSLAPRSLAVCALYLPDLRARFTTDSLNKLVYGRLAFSDITYFLYNHFTIYLSNISALCRITTSSPIFQILNKQQLIFLTLYTTPYGLLFYRLLTCCKYNSVIILI
jgi:hypothetical protein